MPLAMKGIDDVRGGFLVVFNQQYFHETHQRPVSAIVGPRGSWMQAQGASYGSLILCIVRGCVIAGAACPRGMGCQQRWSSASTR
jgi:hypothetical protein